jgi:hypothetical protein
MEEYRLRVFEKQWRGEIWISKALSERGMKKNAH